MRLEPPLPRDSSSPTRHRRQEVRPKRRADSSRASVSSFVMEFNGAVTLSHHSLSSMAPWTDRPLLFLPLLYKIQHQAPLFSLPQPSSPLFLTLLLAVVREASLEFVLTIRGTASELRPSTQNPGQTPRPFPTRQTTPPRRRSSLHMSELKVEDNSNLLMYFLNHVWITLLILWIIIVILMRLGDSCVWFLEMQCIRVTKIEPRDNTLNMHMILYSKNEHGHYLLPRRFSY
jgi:hypothetical protein